MAEFRNIHTRIWTDAWFCELNPEDKLLFIYLFSNPNASVSGMYELPKRNISIDTGLPIEKVSSILDGFSAAGKVYYSDGIVWVVNLKKYNDSGDGLKIQERIRKDLLAIQDCKVKELYCKYHNIPYPASNIPYPSETRRDETEETRRDDGRVNLASLYSSNFGEIYSGELADDIIAVENEYPNEWLIPALDETKKGKGIRNKWKYFKAILENWKKDGFTPKNGIQVSPTMTWVEQPDGSYIKAEVSHA